MLLLCAGYSSRFYCKKILLWITFVIINCLELCIILVKGIYIQDIKEIVGFILDFNSPVVLRNIMDFNSGSDSPKVLNKNIIIFLTI